MQSDPIPECCPTPAKAAPKGPGVSGPALHEAQAPEDALQGAWEPRILAFLCTWCSYAGADLAGVSRIQYPPNVRIIRVPCSGRINPIFLLRALQSGADGVLVSGCHPGDCHYISGNLAARRKFAVMAELMQFAGIEPARIQFTWVSASEGGRFAAIMEKVVEKVRSLGPNTKLVKCYER